MFPTEARTPDRQPTLVERLEQFHTYADFRAFRSINRARDTTDYVTSARFVCEIDNYRQPVFVVVYGNSPLSKNFIVVSEGNWARGGSFSSYEGGGIRIPTRIWQTDQSFDPLVIGLLSRMGQMNPLHDEGQSYGDLGRAKEDVALVLGWAGITPLQLQVHPKETSRNKTLKCVVDALQNNGDANIPRWFGYGLASEILGRDQGSDVHTWWARCVRDTCGSHPDTLIEAEKVPRCPPDTLARASEVVAATDSHFGSVEIRRKISHRLISAISVPNAVTVNAARLEIESFEWTGVPVALQTMLGPNISPQLWDELVSGLATDFSGIFGPSLADRLMTLPLNFSPYHQNDAVIARFDQLRIDLAERYDCSWSRSTAVRLLTRPTEHDSALEGRRITALLEILAWGRDKPGKDCDGSVAEGFAKVVVGLFRDDLQDVRLRTSRIERRIIAACWLRFGGDLAQLTDQGFECQTAGLYADAIFDAEVARRDGGIDAAISVLQVAAEQIIKNPPLNPTLGPTRVIRNLLSYLVEAAKYDDAEDLIRRLFSERTANFMSGKNGFDFAARCAGYYRAPGEDVEWK